MPYLAAVQRIKPFQLHRHHPRKFDNLVRKLGFVVAALFARVLNLFLVEESFEQRLHRRYFKLAAAAAWWNVEREVAKELYLRFAVKFALQALPNVLRLASKVERCWTHRLCKICHRVPRDGTACRVRVVTKRGCSWCTALVVYYFYIIVGIAHQDWSIVISGSSSSSAAAAASEHARVQFKRPLGTSLDFYFKRVEHQPKEFVHILL